MLSLIPLLLSVMLALVNPILLLPLAAFFLAFRYIKNRRCNGSKNREKSLKNKSCKLIYPKVDVKNFNEKTFNINLKISIAKCIAIHSIGLGKYLICGAILFRIIKDESLLREIIASLPVDYSFTVIRTNNYGDAYLLCPKIKASFLNYDNKASMMIGILNSLAATIPADEVKILEGRDLLSFILNANLGGGNYEL